MSAKDLLTKTMQQNCMLAGQLFDAVCRPLPWKHWPEQKPARDNFIILFRCPASDELEIQFRVSASSFNDLANGQYFWLYENELLKTVPGEP